MSSRVIDDRTYTANTGFTLSAAHLPAMPKVKANLLCYAASCSSIDLRSGNNALRKMSRAFRSFLPESFDVDM